MKFTIDKEYTTLAQVAKVKADCKEFKARYTDNDLLNLFADAMISEDIDIPWGIDILSAEINAFPGGTDFDNETCFHVELTCRGLQSFWVIGYYCDLDFRVDTRELAFTPGKKLYHIDQYKKA